MRKLPGAFLALLFSLLLLAQRSQAQGCPPALNGGTLSANAPTVCASYYFTISVAGSSTGTGLTYLWQSSPDGTTWTDLPGASDASLGTMQKATTWYRRKTACSGGATAYSDSLLVPLRAFHQCYCQPFSALCSGAYTITQVQFGGLRNSSDCGSGNFSDYTATLAPARIARGTFQSLAVATGSATARYVHCYVDFNQDGDFGAREYTRLSAPTAAGLYTGYIRVPFGAKLGVTRMRIAYNADAAHSACATSYAGETEDYAVEILPATSTATGFALHVKPSAPGSNGSGASWADALTSVRTAISNAAPGDTIKVAAGTYYAGASRTNGLELTDSIVVLGGYPATGNPLDADRHPGHYPTILSGYENAARAGADYHVLYASGPMNACLVDGFIVQNGGSGNGTDAQNRGGGISIENGANITVRRCVFRNNASYESGSAIAVHHARPSFFNCIVTGNYSSPITVQHNAAPVFVNLLAARNAGAELLLVDSGQVTLKNSTLAVNACSGSLVAARRHSTVSLSNTIAYFNTLSAVNWNSQAFDLPEVQLEASTCTSDYALLQVQQWGTHLLRGVRPRFRDTASVEGADGRYFTADDGFALQHPCSPALNAGGNALADGIFQDILGNRRVFDGTVDLGAYEAQQAATAPPKVLYVNAAATGAGNGSSWDDAFTDLHQALQACSDTIKVAAGTYAPYQNGPKAPYWLENKRIIWGCYPPTGNPADAARDYDRYPTYINGQNAGGQENLLVRGLGLDSSSVLDGFTVTQGGNGKSNYEEGLLLYSQCQNPVISNCRFTGNNGRLLLARDNQDLLLRRCSFEHNTLITLDNLDELVALRNHPKASLQQCVFRNNTVQRATTPDMGYGRILVLRQASAQIDSCSFLQNHAQVLANQASNPVVTASLFLGNIAGAQPTDISNFQSNPVFRNCRFRDSTGTVFLSQRGGICFNYQSNPTFTDCRFENGRVDYYGGVAYSDSSLPVFTNCVFSNCNNAFYNTNSSHIRLTNCIATGSEGSGYAPAFMQNYRSNPVISNCVVVNSKTPEAGLIRNDAQSSPRIYNSIFWRNFQIGVYDSAALKARTEIVNASATQAQPFIRNSMFEFYTAAGSTNTTGKDPRLANYIRPAGEDGRWFTADDGLQLCDCSPAVNTGDNAYVSTPTDLSGQPRMYGGQVDRGAYERQSMPLPAVPATVYVQAGASGAADGSSWARAYGSLHQALQNPCADTLKLAAGVYRPAVADRDSSFTIDRRLVVLGSYDPATGLRDVDAHPTILSGDIGRAQDSTDNSFGLLNAFYIDTLQLDGLVLKEARYDTFPARLPFALNADYIEHLRLYNCRFVNNYSLGNGTLMLRRIKNLDLRQSVFSGNQASAGAGLYLSQCGPRRSLTGCVFERNKASSGGAIWWEGTGGQIANCLFSANEAVLGAGLCLLDNEGVALTNCTFANNRILSPGLGGGGIYSSGRAMPSIANCLFTGNGATPGSVQNPFDDLYYRKSGNPPGQYEVEWPIRNSAVSTPPRYWYGGGLLPPHAITYRNSGNPIGPDGKWFTADDGLQLAPCSDGIDKGENSVVTTPKDLAGNNRIAGTAADLGAYEQSGSSPWASNQLLTRAADSLAANRELTDTAGWTHYYSNCTYLLSVKKKGKNIGSVNDGSLVVKVATTPRYGTGSGTDLTFAAYNTGGGAWYALNRYWTLKATAVLTDSLLVRFPFTTADLGDVQGSNPQLGRPADLEFFTASGAANPLHPAVPATAVSWYAPGAAPSLRTWTYARMDTLHVAEYYVSSFGGSGGGTHATLGLPDLVTGSPSATPAAPEAGATLTISFTETNRGAAPAAGHQVQFYLSADPVLTPGLNGDVLLGTLDRPPLYAAAGAVALTQQLVIPCSTAAGTYTLFLVADGGNAVSESDENNNRSSLTLTISGNAAPAVPVITATPAATACAGTPVALTAASAGCTNCSYRWNTFATGPSLQATASGTYTVTVTNACGTATGSQAVILHPLPAVTVSASAAAVCAGKTVTLSATGAASYSWSGSGLEAATGSTVSATPPAAGSYTYTVTGTSNGCTATKTVGITIHPLPRVTVSPADTSLCTGTPITLDASGAGMFSWTAGPGLIATTMPTVSFVPPASAVYTVTGTSPNGCSATATASVRLVAWATPQVSVSYSGCPGSELRFSAWPVNGGNHPQYQWYVDEVRQAANGADFTLKTAANGVSVFARMIPDLACASPQLATSNPVRIDCIAPPAPPIDSLPALSVGPNPSDGLLTVRLRLPQAETVTFTVVNASGNVVYSSTLTAARGTTTKTIDLRDQPGGLYFLKMAIGRNLFVEKILLIK
ncbi:right-handed parallel beta-helix repeat-containing protein [Paraflavisolibacter sp. H34]|uniref:right-handed parallel beta-helix repeat-containing protein n=1 Tax=Huijunlia imazamoxiresistens TaxID=3127457 RepID=UPI00301662C9